jgi:excisionase family DNA binding protein
MRTTELENRLTVRPSEAAAMLGVSRRTIDRLILDKRLRSTGGGGRGRAVLIPVVDIRKFALGGDAS